MSRNKELNEKIKEERRQQILSNALKLFAANGLTATKIKDICSASGISQGLVYHYFRSKEDIYVQLIKYAFGRMNAACRELESLVIPPRDKIKMAIEGLIQSLKEDEDTARYYLLVAQATVSEAIPEAAKSIIRNENMTPYKVITRIIIEGQKDGSIKSFHAEELALVFWTSISGLAINRAVHGDKFKAPDPAILTSIFI